jgi:hypothetical protein
LPQLPKRPLLQDVFLFLSHAHQFLPRSNLLDISIGDEA